MTNPTLTHSQLVSKVLEYWRDGIGRRGFAHELRRKHPHLAVSNEEITAAEEEAWNIQWRAEREIKENEDRGVHYHYRYRSTDQKFNPFSQDVIASLSTDKLNWAMVLVSQFNAPLHYILRSEEPLPPSVRLAVTYMLQDGSDIGKMFFDEHMRRPDEEKRSEEEAA